MQTTIWAILIFCLLIFIHEFGHFITAKLSGMTVHEFSIGMGPQILSFGKKTKYSLRLLPIGGFVKLEGEDGESGDPNAFCNKSMFKRFCVLFAGAFMNILLGFLIFIIVFSSVNGTPSNCVDTVLEGSAFADAGVKPGDKIIKMEGEKFSTSVHTYDDISLFMYLNGENTAKITFERNGKKVTKDITPKYSETDKRALLGFIPQVDKMNLINVFYYSFWQCIYVIKSVVFSIWWLICGIVPASSMSGPVAIVNQIGVAARAGWRTVLNFAGFISVNLGVMNLLPIPALDGGRILFLIIEKIRGKKMNPDREGMVNFVFLVLLLLLMVLVTFNDVLNLGKSN
ncbi:MAG: RIP metalloprotease RseP [Clostridia bacterium]|nr:RIP metalloprotease RseP [Clostridia bacterium]